MTEEITATSVAEVAAGPGDRRGRMRARWLVHLGLMLTLIVSLVPLLMFSASLRVTLHWVSACLFAAFIVAHLGQRRLTLARLAAAAARMGRRLRPARRLALSAVVFSVLLVNVIVSGVLDVASGGAVMVPFLHLNWHAAASLLFLGYLVTHVIRRRQRLRKSAIR